MQSEKFEQLEIFYLCEYLDGEFGTGDGPEFNQDTKYIDSGKYIPEIVPIEKVKDILLLPLEIKEKLIEDINSGKI